MRKKKDFSEKPYNRCLSCNHRKVRCDGARSSAMELSRWCEYMRDMKEANGLTNAEIAEISGVSVKTIERLMAQNADQDIMRETARRIENAIIGSSNQYPCYLAFEEEHHPNEQKLNDALRELQRVLDDNEDYKAALDNIHTSYQAELNTVRTEAQKKIDYLMAQVDRLQKDNDNLWAENNRKAKLVDMFWESRKITITENKDENK